MTKLIHGGDIYSHQEKHPGGVVDFSANINPQGLPAGVKDAVIAALDGCANYPDPLCRELTEAIAQSEKLPREYILCGNGASDLIYRLVYAVRPKTAVVTAPAFEEYEQALTAAGCEVRHHLLCEEEDFLLTERILDDLTDDVQLLFLCNPNNPTGQPVQRALLTRILQHCREHNILLALDECFCDFLDEPENHVMNEFLPEYSNLILLRAFTKMYAMAGLRLGYCLCGNRSLLDAMYLCGSTWAVSNLAQAAGVQALREREYLARTKLIVAEERAYLKARLAALGCKVYGSHANYIFFRPHVSRLRERLEVKGYLIRNCENFKGLSGEFCRIAVKSHEDNTALLHAMEEVALCP
ncbi:histidinol-phosphate transaminase [Hydrogenoanaerobacterium sp.]|uniref:pyridoxal phosphate-dependent aminotransferase n=1 Tax=Hydrogenoanaerobacterium sp. TaxID=2953763 RepID=UPI00289A7496|nr:histidinol-phosphate transaminase [Hydrogenoanaerobacterium sp.]